MKNEKNDNKKKNNENNIKEIKGGNYYGSTTQSYSNER